MEGYRARETEVGHQRKRGPERGRQRRQGHRSASADTPIPFLPLGLHHEGHVCVGLEGGLARARAPPPGDPGQSGLGSQAAVRHRFVREPQASGGSEPPSVTVRWAQSSPTPRCSEKPGVVLKREGRGEARTSTSLTVGRHASLSHCASPLPPTPTHVDNGLLGLRHVGDDAVRDDEQHRVLGAVLHRGRVPRAGGG